MSTLINQKESLNSDISHSSLLLKRISEKRIFVVHRHLGSILHYDLRIEINGALKSWAIPSGPSMNPGDRRLAIMTDDLPLAYASFSGVVPEGSYGAGIVERWDRGFCVAHSVQTSRCSEYDLACQLREGRLKFTLKGRKLKGVFSLVRLNDRADRWLLIKGNDKFAVDHQYNCEAYIPDKSIINKFLKNRRVPEGPQ
jgi:bifunctional non-homologous end joining protein LigD